MPDDYRIRKILDLLERDPAKGVPELASLVNLSRSRLGHLFKLEMGVDLSHFLANERLEKAADLLRRTELSIKEIAATVGYHHASSFDRGFQNKFGVAPADFRRQHRSEAYSMQRNGVGTEQLPSEKQTPHIIGAFVSSRKL